MAVFHFKNSTFLSRNTVGYREWGLTQLADIWGLPETTHLQADKEMLLESPTCL